MVMANFDVPTFKTIKETAKITNLAEYRVRKIVKTGKVRYILAGKKFLINLNSLLADLNDGDNKMIIENERGNNGNRKII